jgi:hypothetical protein
MRYDGASPTRCGTVGVSPGKQICSAATVRTSWELGGARRWRPWVKIGGGLGSYRGEVRMHTEIEGRDGPERCHVVFFLPDREEAFLLSSLVQSRMSGLGVLGSKGGGVGA